MHGRRITQRWKVPAMVGIACLFASVASAQQWNMTAYPDPAYEVTPVAGRSSYPAVPVSMAYSELEARVQALEASLAAQKEPGGAAEDWKDVSAEKFSVQLGGRVYGDFVMFPLQDAASQAAYGDLDNYFEFRTLRLNATGQGFGIYDYKVELDFEPESTPTVLLKDVYAGIHDVPLLGYVRFGHFKEPFSLEQLTSNRFITFMERSLADAAFVPARNVGVSASNHTENEAFTWAYGAFFNDISETRKERVSDDQGINLSVRGTWNPVYTAEGRGVLHVGLGYHFRDLADDRITLHVRPETHEESYFLSTGELDARNLQVLQTEMACVYGPLSLQSELFWATVDGLQGLPNWNYYGAYVYGSWFLTGENRVYDRKHAVFTRVTPYTNFFLVRTPSGTQAGWGAWELACRWSYVDLSEGVVEEQDLRGKLNDFTLGVNWYWNPNMRMMMNWIHAFSDLNAFGSADTDILATRLQVDF